MFNLNLRRRAWAVLASASAAILVSGCGGGVESGDVAQDSALQPVQYSVIDTSQPDHGTSDSLFVKPGSEFNGFNPELWNDRKAWYECDCGRHPQKQKAKIMTWNPI
jgi:hypothetical protein